MDLIIIMLGFVFIIILYFLCSTLITTVLAKIPRLPVNDKPNWGVVEECQIPTRNNKTLEGWIVYPESLKSETDPVKLKQNPAIILIHGWGRDRGRMTSRARVYGRNGYTTILISARDHGRSDKEFLGMSILRFSQDIEACVQWWGMKVILNGHSIGGGASLLVSSRNPSLVKAVIAESAPHAFPYGLKYVYSGNVPSDNYEDTNCPKCNEKMIDREGYSVERFDDEGKCSKCGEGLSIV